MDPSYGSGLKAEQVSMSLMFVAISAALLQMAFMLGTSRILGPEEYSHYSLALVEASFGAVLVFEWIRLILIRHAGASRFRMRRALLATIRSWTEVLAFWAIAIAILAFAGCLLIGRRETAIDALACGLTIPAMGLTNCVTDYLRFNADNRVYNRFALVRAIGGGCITLVSAALFRSGAVALVAFAVSIICIAGLFRWRYWPRDSRYKRHRLIARFWRYGVFLASSAITTNFAFAASRAGLALILDKSIAGAVFLSLDLMARGVAVLGQAVNTMNIRSIFDAKHQSGDEGAKAEFRRTSSVFVGIWGIAAIYGAIVSFVIPLIIMTPHDANLYGIVTAVNIAALLLIGLRVYCFDVLLSAIDAPFEVTIAAVSLAAVTGVVAFGGSQTYPMLAAFSLPIGVAISMTALLQRNWQTFQTALKRDDMLYLLYKVAWLTSAVFCIRNFSPLAVVIALAGVAADLAWGYRFYRAWLARRLPPD
jgi:hypothetical protein